MQIAAAILAGGHALRLGGVAKGLLTDDAGLSIIARLVEELKIAGIAEIVISANSPHQYRTFDKPIVADIHPNLGPLGGIEAVLAHFTMHCQSVVLLACDLPNITADEILKLIDAHRAAPSRIVVAGTPEGQQPLCAVVPVAVLPQVTAAIAAGSLGVGRLWRSLGAWVVEIDDPARFLNINTPRDLREWRESAGNIEKD